MLLQLFFFRFGTSGNKRVRTVMLFSREKFPRRTLTLYPMIKLALCYLRYVYFISYFISSITIYCPRKNGDFQYITKSFRKFMIYFLFILFDYFFAFFSDFEDFKFSSLGIFFDLIPFESRKFSIQLF